LTIWQIKNTRLLRSAHLSLVLTIHSAQYKVDGKPNWLQSILVENAPQIEWKPQQEWQPLSKYVYCLSTWQHNLTRPKWMMTIWMVYEPHPSSATQYWWLIAFHFRISSTVCHYFAIHTGPLNCLLLFNCLANLFTPGCDTHRLFGQLDNN
jgi:hypothetical protein